jgi:GntR family transcriptional regulator/MocR family aminotransferase
VTLHPRRRREVAGWGGVVIEDDYDGEFRYDRQPVGALQALAPDHVIYAGTASKSLAPILRLGWLVVPPRLLDAVTAELVAGPSGLDQLTLAEFITSGGYDRQIRRTRLAYRRRRDRFIAMLPGQGPPGQSPPHQGPPGQGPPGQGPHVSGIAAGLHAVLDLPRTDLEHDMIARASERGLALDGLERYRAGPGPGDERAGLVIGYARPPEHAYTAALARLRAVLSC